VPIICYALQQLKAKDLDFGALQRANVQQDVKECLDRFFMGRIGIRMLVGHYVESLERPGGRVHRVNVERITREACDRATKLCAQYCGEAPPVTIRVTPSANMPFMYVESHLHHMIFELVKNAMRATVEHHRSRAKQTRRQVRPYERVMNPKSPSLGFFIPDVEDVAGVRIFPDASEQPVDGSLPPVDIVICQGKEDLTVKVTDQGGGVPRSHWDKLWHYDYSTSPLYPPVDPENYPTYREQFSGGGYGLPMARLFARYFGGDITFSSQEGVGSTGFIQAHRLGTNMESVVPLRRRAETSAVDWEADRLAA
jgi:pyruvate dehydrogenase kinase 2/3/4